MKNTVFFSWQATRSAREGRNLIEKALKMAIEKVANDAEVEPALRDGLDLDKDTKNVPGNPPIFDTILRKIGKAAVFVPDLTAIAKREDGELIPNANVLIEYGWALKSLSYHSILPVMNTAHGDPKTEKLPFDLSHLRHPITYHLAEGAGDADLRKECKSLAAVLEGALRTILDSEEFKARLPKPPEPPVFPRQQALDGDARFRAKGKPLGVIRETMNKFLGKAETTSLLLGAGTAYWFRMMPINDPGRLWRVQEIKQVAVELSVAPILHIAGSIGFVDGGDGGGFYGIEGGNTTRSVAYVFRTGEIWMLDSWLAQIPSYLELDESAFAQTLEIAARVLSDGFVVSGPYQWEAGFEGIGGRMLTLRENAQRTWGTSVREDVKGAGTFSIGDNANVTLRPFFEEIFDAFGSKRTTRN
jgi:hypothetical protein